MLYHCFARTKRTWNARRPPHGHGKKGVDHPLSGCKRSVWRAFACVRSGYTNGPCLEHGYFNGFMAVLEPADNLCHIKRARLYFRHLSGDAGRDHDSVFYQRRFLDDSDHIPCRHVLSLINERFKMPLFFPVQ